MPIYVEMVQIMVSFHIIGIFVNTGIEYDASDAGATPSEAVSWGKL